MHYMHYKDYIHHDFYVYSPVLLTQYLGHCWHTPCTELYILRISAWLLRKPPSPATGGGNHLAGGGGGVGVPARIYIYIYKYLLYLTIVYESTYNLGGTTLYHRTFYQLMTDEFPMMLACVAYLPIILGQTQISYHVGSHHRS